ncbi:MAG: hypothetical protein H6709_05295 [Kofleriaceae bacterium]|nr:hypothetical protein [Myxococcales bacterium]MCB9559876.1 hypothetical protein [Kofleriaceae bacterium]MCB9571488.1 hypothetical protein [Kofleriaceae bacterium]
MNIKLPLSLFGAALLASGVGACAFDEAGVTDQPEVEARLHGRVFLDLAPTSHVGVVATDADGEVMPYVEPQVVGGRAVLRTTDDGWLLVEDLEVQLADVRIPPGELGPDAVDLTDVELRLGTQLAAEPYYSGDGRAAWGAGDADLLLDWSLVTSEDGGAWPLATQKMGAMDFTVAVVLDDDGNLSAQVDTGRSGEVHRLNGLVTFSDLSVAVDAVTPTVD